MANGSIKVGDLVVLNNCIFQSWNNFLWRVVDEVVDKQEQYIFLSRREDDMRGLPPKVLSESDIKHHIPIGDQIKFPFMYY